MYMGLNGRPHPDKGFDGKILLLRVSEQQELKQAMNNEQFVDNSMLNQMIKDGDWWQLHSLGMTIAELRGTVTDNYQLEDDVADRLSFSYQTFIGKSGNTDTKLLEDDDLVEQIEYRLNETNEIDYLNILEVSMSVRYEKGDLIEEDVNCDSTFMLANIHKVGEAIRTAFRWVPRAQVCYLYMDNAGGHGTVEAIAQYTAILKDEFNIEIVHQIPRSPETNTLDLGIWCSLQWAVDRLMRGRRGDIHALNKGVREVWASTDLQTAFVNVWKRLGRVLHLIEEDDGGNDLVEGKRGKKWASLDEPLPYENGAAAAAAAAAPVEDHLQAVIDLLEEDEDDEFDE
jgi:hypothetical protein